MTPGPKPGHDIRMMEDKHDLAQRSEETQGLNTPGKWRGIRHRWDGWENTEKGR